MTRYLDSRQSENIPTAPDVPTLVRTDPRIKATVWTMVAAVAMFAVCAVVAFNIL